MAWFEGFSSLKGQLTNLAKGVLNEENEGSRVELTASSANANTDPSENSKGNEEAKNWNDAFLTADNFIDPASVPLSPWSNEESHLHTSTHQPDKTTDKHTPTDSEIGSIIPRGLANFFTQHVSSSASNKGEDREGSREVHTQTEGEISEQISLLSNTNRILQQHNASLSTEVASLSRVVEDLESQVAVSQDENANLSTGLEELDIQHQQAIEQVLVVKDETQKQYEVLQTRYSLLESNFEKELNERLEKRLGEHRREMRDSETMCSIPAQLEDACVQCDSVSTQHQNNDNIDFMKELEERDNELELVLCENTRLREVVKELQDEIERQNESLPAIPENSEEVEALELRVSVLENETSILREVRSNLETEVASSRAIIEDLSRRLQISDAMIRNQDTNAQCSDEEKIASSVREQCEQELNALREHCEKVESSLRSLELQSGDALAKLRREVEEKDRRREELERELERLQNEMAEERRQYSMNLEVENASYKRKISQLQGELQKMDEQLDKLQKEHEIKDKKMCALVFETNSIKEEFDFYKNEMDSNYSSLKEEYDAFRESSNTSESAAKQVLHVETQVTDDINSRSKLVNLENELKHQQDMHSEIETELKLQIKEQELMIQSLKESELNIKHEFMNKKSECESLQLRIEDLQRELEQSDVTMKEQKAEYDSERDALVKQLDSLKQISNEFDLSKDIFKQKEIEFKNQLELKDDEIVSLKNRLKSLNERFNELNCKLTENIDYKEISAELQEKYNTLLETSNKSAEEAQQKICSMMEELKELKTIIEASEQRLKQSEENSNHNLQMCESIKLEFLKKIENERLEYEEKIEKINLEKRLLEGKLGELTKENDEKITTISTENQQLKQKLEMENVKCLNYQNEIERLNSVLMTEKTKFEKCLQEKQQEIAAEKIIAANFMAKQNEMEDVLKNKNKEITILSQEVGSLKNQLEYASQLLSVVPRQEAEGQQVADANISGSQNQSCPNGCKETQDELNRIREALMKEQTENKLLKNQVNDLNEKVGKSTSQLSRLQAHLLSVEENYTSELQNAQLKITDLQGKLVEADDRARNSSTAYTSANIRANQQVESLNQQLRLLTEHKEKLEAELSKAEDNIQRQNAAVTNLQAVLDHFQRDKKKDIDFETERLRQSLNAQCKKNEDLLNEIKLLQDQLNETKKGLAAANRLSEQLDQKSEIISNLKTQVDELMAKLRAEEEKVKAASSNVERKVDRNLMKNLFVGYISSPANSKDPVLKVLAQVLDLNKEERQKIGLETGPTTQQQSLSEAFIRFLESESQPKPQIILPLNQPSTSAPASRKTSQSSGGSLLLTDAIPNLPHFTIGRNSGSLLNDVLKDRNS